MQSALGPIIGPKEVHPENLDGRVAVVIGGANGIGFEITRALVHAGCKVIMVNRKQEQGDAALETLRGEVPNAQVDWRGCDMGTLGEVRDVFSGLKEEVERLDFVACSAGINAEQYGEVNDGLDRHFAVNYLGQFYAVNQLWPLLRKTSRKGDGPKPRVVFLSSEQHRGTYY
jgi:NAD(P)-dependent dehydrogenase (short-subunit alcohol dehydrogenase family)